MTASGKTFRKPTVRMRRLRYLARRAVWAAVIVAVGAALIAADRRGLFGLAIEPDYGRYHGRSFRIVKVVDGDTLDVNVRDDRAGRQTTRIRLWGVDTPETVKPDTPTQHFGPEASACTKRLCSGRRVRLELVKGSTRGTHGRLLAYVILPDGRTLNAVLIAEGYGYADPRFDHPRKSEYRSLQRRARKGGLGLWESARQKDLPYYYQDTITIPPQR